jgi:hypothetical protein
LLLLRRQTVETLQALLQPLLPLRRQTAECGIILQRSLLLFGREISVAAQPLPGAGSPLLLLARRLRRPLRLGSRRPLYFRSRRPLRLGWLRAGNLAPLAPAALRRARRGTGERHHKDGSPHPSRHGPQP